LPLVGMAGLRRQIRTSDSERLRAPARLLFSVLVATVAVEVALAVAAGVLEWLQWPQLTLLDPTTSPLAAPPIALSFWASRLSLPIAAVTVLVTSRRSGAVVAQRLFGRGLAVVLVTALIGCLYVVVETAAGRITGPVVADGAAVAVSALAFLPLFLIIERATDRLLYGPRPEPYSVLAALTALSPATTRGVPDLASVAEAVGQGLGATTCRLTVHRPGLRDRSYGWVRSGEETATTLQEIPIRHGGRDVGTIAIDRAALAGADEQRRDLLEATANSLGVLLQAVRAGIDLERQLRAALAHATEIADARRRAVAEADSERRRIERDLHDGAQHHLVSLSLTLGLAEHEVGAGRLAQARSRLEQVGEQLDTAESVLARTATGVSSPALADRGVVAALRAEFGDDPHIRLDATGVTVARFSPEIEGAVYFCCLESVNNARKHAPGAPVRVRLSTADGRLHFAVRDDGPGWNPRAGGTPGRGLQNMASRIAAVGGQLGVRSAPGTGTAVDGWVPLPDAAVDRPAAASRREPGLLEQVRAAVRAARDLYHATPHAEPLQELAERLDQPLRVAVVGPPGPEVPLLIERLGKCLPGGSVSLVAVPGLGSADAGEAGRARDLVLPHEPAVPAADAHVLLLPTSGNAEAFYGELLGHRRRLRPVQTIGVLAGPGRDADGRPGAAGPPVEACRLCSAVVVLLRTGPAGSDGCDSCRPGSPGDGGPARLCELVQTRFVARAEVLKARTVVTALAALLRTATACGDRRPLAYELDRIRNGAHELAELDLLDALRAGELVVPDDERGAAERLLGLHGTDLPARLGTGTEELADTALRQLGRWQQTAAHPTSTADGRRLALLMVQMCERLLASASPPRPGAGAGSPYLRTREGAASS
jgi:signal transduction histidine kinase